MGKQRNASSRDRNYRPSWLLALPQSPAQPARCQYRNAPERLRFTKICGCYGLPWRKAAAFLLLLDTQFISGSEIFQANSVIFCNRLNSKGFQEIARRKLVIGLFRCALAYLPSVRCETPSCESIRRRTGGELTQGLRLNRKPPLGSLANWNSTTLILLRWPVSLSKEPSEFESKQEL
jgi:hypothetical protein